MPPRRQLSFVHFLLSQAVTEARFQPFFMPCLVAVRLHEEAGACGRATRQAEPEEWSGRRSGWLLGGPFTKHLQTPSKCKTH